MLSKNLELSLHRAFELAQKNRHEFITIEHLLLSLTKDVEIIPILKACQVSVKELRKVLDVYLTQYLEPLEKLPPEITSTLGFQRVMERAANMVTASGRGVLDSPNVLVALLEEDDSFAANCLSKLGATRFSVVQHLTQTKKIDLPSEEEEETPPPSALELYCENLNDKVSSGMSEPLIGRKNELERAYQILSRRTKNNPLFIGEPGVGKTALAEGMAAEIIAKTAPKFLHETQIYALNLGSMLAGSRYRGEFEGRLNSLIQELKTKKSSILFIDELHGVMGAGAISGGSTDAASLLKPLLNDGTLRCMGATTHADFRQHLEKDRAFIRRFQEIEVKEPSREETIEILKGLISRYESHHKVKYALKIIEAAVDLTVRFVHNRCLPDKAIDLLDEVGARHHLATPTKKNITLEELEQVLSQMIKAPVQTVTSDDRALLQTLEPHLQEVIFGQNAAISSVTRAIKLSRSGLRDPQKPIGSFLFTGPTGVGKTELAKQLAQHMGIAFVRFDMSEYMEKHSVSKLIGTPPGYVGFEQGGLLSDVISDKPHCVLLLDEIEKAHPDLLNLLLQVMDYGKLKDHNGREVDFRHVVLILTTNAGAQDLEKHPLGFTKTHGDHDVEGILKKIFTPEFRNRLDAIVPFAALNPVVMTQVVDKFLAQLDALLMEKHVTLFVDDTAKEWLAREGYAPALGARPLHRLIQDSLKYPLSEELLFGKLKKGGLVRVALGANGLEFTYDKKLVSV